MAQDIVERLRADHGPDLTGLLEEAASEIERMRAAALPARRVYRFLSKAGAKGEAATTLDLLILEMAEVVATLDKDGELD